MLKMCEKELLCCCGPLHMNSLDACYSELLQEQLKYIHCLCHVRFFSV